MCIPKSGLGPRSTIMRFLVPFLAPAISTLTASITPAEAEATLTATAAELEAAGANIVQSIKSFFLSTSLLPNAQI